MWGVWEPERTLGAQSVTVGKREITTVNAYEQHHLHRTTFFNAFKRKVAVWVERVFCCGGDLEATFVDLDRGERFQRAVLRARVNPAVVDEPLLEQYQRYRGFQSPRSLDAAPNHGMIPIEPSLRYFCEYAVKIDNAATEPAALPIPDVDSPPCDRVSAPVVGAVLACVDCKLGPALEDTPANRLVVNRLALLIMREHDMRKHDVARHIAHVVDCYFMAREHLLQAGGTRRRASKWLLRTFGFKSDTVGAG